MSNLKSSWAIHWFRRDLRIDGNPALLKAHSAHEGRVLGLFSIDGKFLQREDFSHDRFAFFLKALQSLKQDLRARGGDLLVTDKGPDEAFTRIAALCKQAGAPAPATVSFNRDYEPYARARDERVTQLIRRELGAEIFTECDHLLIEPHEILKDDGTPYQVFTPYARRWMARLASSEVQKRVKDSALTPALQPEGAGKNNAAFQLTWPRLLGAQLPEDRLEAITARNAPHVSVSIPEAGAARAMQRLAEFQDDISEYGEKRDVPAIAGTSQLSIHLKNGSLTAARVIRELKLGPSRVKTDTPDSRQKFLQEIIWREFYYQILWHFPRVETGAFNESYADLQWENDPALFEAWKEGRTGFPIVDAGMRQLKETGWMHNRVRMVVASFLTKDLLIDWRWGEKWFMQRLLDGDLAPNNGGWQWAASTGCDPQPYFRVFNPELQAKRYDPDGDYIRRWVPEWGTDAYPRPCVEHSSRKARAIALYQRAKQAPPKPRR